MWWHCSRNKMQLLGQEANRPTENLEATSGLVSWMQSTSTSSTLKNSLRTTTRTSCRIDWRHWWTTRATLQPSEDTYLPDALNQFFVWFDTQHAPPCSRHWFYSTTRWDPPYWKMECLGRHWNLCQAACRGNLLQRYPLTITRCCPNML